MLVIISDLHLTDGTSGASVPPGAFQIFAERVADLALRASWRSDGAYRPIDRLDVVLLGDILDVIRSTQWVTPDGVRPWGDPQSAGVADRVEQITADILRVNEPSLAVLRALAREGGLRLPAAFRTGRPTSEVVPLPVHIHYMVGNHDWFFHLAGPRYDGLRRTIIERMGLADRHDAPFAHDPAENEPLLETMRRHRLLARHGDIYDPFNFEQDRDASSLGDVLIIELMNRFTTQVERELGEDLPAAVVLGLREIDNIRPLLLVPVWVDGLLERGCPSSSMRKRVKQIWDRMADDFLSLDYVRQRDSWNPIDLIDGLERALKFTRRLSLGWASSITSWLAQLRGGAEESYYRFALSEQDFRNRRAKHIIYGHTHQPESVPLDASYADGYVHNQVYLNAGTWRRVHCQTRLAPGEHEFIASDTMTLLAFFHADERSGRPYESWSGTLGVELPEATIHRVDASHVPTERPNLSPGEPLPTPSGPHRAPHYSPAASRTGAAPGGIVPMRRVR
jgi:UDP-2,3-diacylglucosamine pyrophosphatase LpxH